MQLKFHRHDLPLVNAWAIAGGVVKHVHLVVFVELTDNDGMVGIGEASPSRRYHETVESAQKFFAKVDAARLSFLDVASSMNYLAALAPGEFSAKSALNVALLDGAARRARQPLHEFLGLGFRENRHVTSFSIGIDHSPVIRKKVLAAADFPILKMKLGSVHDRENFAALRAAAPGKSVRVDANEAWRTKEQALENIEWLVCNGGVQFVEQPMPTTASAEDCAWLKARSSLPLFADESFHFAADAARCAEGFHGVNVKLCKTGGVTAAVAALRAARAAGLQTMLGCMIESSLLISAAAHLAHLADFLDLDGNLLVTGDPFRGVTAERGMLSFAAAPEKFGLCVAARAAAG
ncbi:MAG: dipeptide epimerase [Verrucomicrobia bacterium]|nr:dipeptide epimerase [Verrucomicrobiota bacterium]